MTRAAANPPQMTDENLRDLQAARQALRKVRRAVLSAKIEGYSIAVFGVISFLAGIGSIGDMLGGAVLTAIGIIEIIAAGQLRRLDPRATKLLACNQLVLAALILLYALWSLHAEVVHPASDFSDLSPQDAQAMQQMLSSTASLTHEVLLALYGSLIAAAVAEAGMALYYHSRGPHLRQFLAQTPEWIIAMQKAGVSI